MALTRLGSEKFTDINAKLSLKMLDACSALVQVLKIMRYTVKFLLASALKESKSDFTQRLKAFESSVGTSR